ncbi:unnamed protein product [Coccothraustes coccothraustes]
MAEGQSRKIVEFHISNRTYNTTLKYHRTDNDKNFPHLASALPSGHSDSGHLFSHSNALGHGWLAIYEADSFTLAIFFFLPKEPEHSRNLLELEVSLDKAHLGDFRETFDRMTLVQNPPNPEQTVGSCAWFSGGSEVSVTLLTGPYEVTATAFRDPNPRLEVQMEDRVILPMCGPF